LLCASAASSQWIPANPVTKVEKQPDGLLFTMQTGKLKLQICTDSIVHVVYAPVWPPPQRKNYVVTKNEWPAVNWSMQAGDKDVSISTDRLSISVTRAGGMIGYSDPNGKALFAEGPKRMTAAVV